MKNSRNRILDVIAMSRSSDESLWAKISRVDPWIFAHHPSHPCFHEHVWKWKGLYFCKGCVVTLLGMFIGLVSLLCVAWLNRLATEQIAILFVLFLLPSVFTALLGAPRWVKHCARFFLGVLMIASIWLLFATESWVVRISIVCSYFAFKIPLDRRRRLGNEMLLASQKQHSASTKARKIVR